MFKSKKGLLSLALVFVLLLSMFVTGCSTNTSTETEEPSSEAPATEEPASEEASSKDDEKVVINVAGGAVGIEYDLSVKAAEEYMKQNPNVQVNIIETPDSSNDRLGLYLQMFEAKSSEIDVMQVDVIWPGDLSEHFLDLYEYGAKDVADKHFEAIVENNTVDGKLVAIPWFTDAGLLYYRQDLLDEYGLEVPKTWDDLEAAAKKIQEGQRAEGNQDFWGYVWQGNSYEGLTCDALEWVVSNGGGTIVSPDKKITINNEKAIEIIDQAASWVGTISPEGVTALGEEESRAIWQSGNAAFMRNWPYAYSLSKGDDSQVKGKFGVAALPAGDSGSGAATVGGWQLAVSKYSEHPEIAADVALFMASPEMQKMRAVDGSFNPTIKDLYEDEDVLAANPFFGDLYEVFINAAARPSTATSPKYNEASTYFFKAVHSVLTGEEDAQSALEVLELDLQDLLGYEIGEPQN